MVLYVSQTHLWHEETNWPKNVPIITAFLVATFVLADLTINVARCRNGESVAKVS